jgi:tetratricopeptide (TPR) repeat protein
MAQGWQEFAAQLHMQAMLRLQEGWVAENAARYDDALRLYDEAYQLLQQSVQYSSYNTPHEVFYQLAQCCLAVAQIQQTQQDMACVQNVQRALAHLSQAAQLSLNNSSYISMIEYLQAWLASMQQAYQEAAIQQIMEQVRHDPQRNQLHEEVRQALQHSDQLLEWLNPGSTNSWDTQQWEEAEEAELRRAAEDRFMRENLREHIGATGGSTADFDAWLYAFDQMRQQKKDEWQQAMHEKAEAVRQHTYEEYERGRVRFMNSRLGILHPKPCSCWSCQQGYT